MKGQTDKRPIVLRVKAFLWLAAAAFLAAGVATLYSSLGGNAETDSKVPASELGHAMTRGPFEVVVATSGIIQPFEIVDVGAQVSGQLARLHVKLGDRVGAGQLLAEIDDRLIRARLVQGEAAAENLRAQIQAKHAQITYARAQQARTDSLVERSITTRSQAELARSTTDALAAEARALEAQLAGQLAALDAIRLDLGYARIDAPLDGVVTTVVAQRGQTLNANQQAPIILRISRDRPLILLARVPEADFERVSPGMLVRFTLLGGPSRVLTGTVSNVLRAPTIINEVVFYDAVIVLDDDQGALAFGRTVQAFIVMDRLDCAVRLPRQSLPETAAPGEMISVSIRKPTGGVSTRVVPLRALTDLWGAIACHEADHAGIDPPDRLLRANAHRRSDI
jgi:macrolide-specific efflux system membrane fusion protein